MVSKAVNNTKLYGQIDILGDQSELHGKDIYVSASAPRESEVQYRKEAKYRAETVTEFVKQTVERITTTIEKVAEKVIKWLPWPFNKIVKWITKTVVRVIRWTEEILVEKVLQSKTEAKEEAGEHYHRRKRTDHQSGCDMACGRWKNRDRFLCI